MTTDAQASQPRVPHMEGLTVKVTAVSPNKKWDWTVTLNGEEIPDGGGRCNTLERAVRDAKKAARSAHANSMPS